MGSPEKILWIVNHYALPPGGVGGTRHFTLAKHLKALGWRAIIIAASTELNTGTQRLRADEPSRLETIDGVEFLWLRAPVYRGNRLGRLINMLVFAGRAWRLKSRVLLPKPDAVLGSCPHPFASFTALLLARHYRVPFYYEIRDLWPEGLVELAHISPNHPLMLLFGWMERYEVRRARKIVTLLPGICQYLVPLGVKEDDIVWVPNGIDASLFAVVEPPPARQPFTLMYFGAHGIANGLDNLISAMEILRDEGVENIRLRLVGDGPMKAALQAQVVAKDLLLQVSFESPVPKSAIPALAAGADGFVFNLVDAPVFIKYGVSANKLFDFMAAARPVLFCCKAGNDPVQSAQCGFTVEPNNPRALADAIKQLATMPLSERQAMGQRGRAYVLEHHGFENLARKLAAMLDS